MVKSGLVSYNIGDETMNKDDKIVYYGTIKYPCLFCMNALPDQDQKKNELVLQCVSAL